jgi:hypothetical protein
VTTRASGPDRLDLGDDGHHLLGGDRLGDRLHELEERVGLEYPEAGTSDALRTFLGERNVEAILSNACSRRAPLSHILGQP